MFDSSNEINIINPAYAGKLGLKNKKTINGVQKIDDSILEIIEIVIANLQLEDKASRPKFFQEIFLTANTKFEVILEMSFLKISNTDVLFGKERFM